MNTKRFGTIAAVTATAALLLTACGGTEDKAADRAAADKATQGAAPGADAAAGSSEFDFLSGTAKQNKAQPKTGDWANAPGTPQKWVQLSAARAGALDPVVVNGAGFTLYRFDNDTANPSTSTCNDACATTWPPVVVAPGGRIFIDGVKKSDVGVVKRDDGKLQVTIGGWPVYRFNKDLKPGDTNGQGVGGTWFGVTPNGEKAGGGASAPAGGGGNSSVTLSDEKNFGDPSEGLAGTGCQNVGRDNRASSLQASGTVKIWTEKDCKGTSKSVSGNIADLASIGFDNTVSSVRFG
ncbi:hypothetical protein ACGFYP_33005 [Streptomyces sp. NPDC048370]|uniref:COG4315 family predicted lipoprotein n=1 Tax=Streptomyces sp. NPDC048370 TaxID=3365540 RepID=UPI003723031A